MKSPATASPSTRRKRGTGDRFAKHLAEIETVTVIHGDKGTGKTTLANLICESHVTPRDRETATNPGYRLTAPEIKAMTLHLLLEHLHSRGTRHLVIDVDRLHTALPWLESVNLKPTRIIHLTKGTYTL